MDPAKELDLIARAQAGDSDAEWQLVKAHTGMLRLLSAKAVKTGGLERQDAFQEASLAFVLAIRSFEAGRGCRLGTYGYWQVAGALRRYSKAENRPCPERLEDADKLPFREEEPASANTGWPAPLELVEEVLARLPMAMRRAMRMRFAIAVRDVSFMPKAIAASPGVSVQRVDTLLNEAFYLIRRDYPELIEALPPATAARDRLRHWYTVNGTNGSTNRAARMCGASWGVADEVKRAVVASRNLKWRDDNESRNRAA